MTKLEERYSQLRGDVEELRIVHEEYASELDKSVKQMESSKKRELQNPTVQNHELNAKIAMTVTDNQIISLRSQIDILKRISDDLSNELEDKLNIVDRHRLKENKLLEEHFTKINNNEFKITNQEDVKRLDEIYQCGLDIRDLGQHVDDVISTALKYFIRTLEYLDPERKFKSLT